MDIEIRSAELDDLAALAALNSQVQDLHIALAPDLYRHPEPGAVSDWFREQLASSDYQVLVATKDGNPVGYVLLRIDKRPPHTFCHDRSCIYIDQISVDTPYRKRGIARALLEAVKGRARQEGIDTVELDVRSDNEMAKSAFRSLGFAVYHEKMALTIE